jgi:hypothetical protein
LTHLTILESKIQFWDVTLLLDFIKIGFVWDHSASFFRVLMLDVEASHPGRIKSSTLSLGEAQN